MIGKIIRRCIIVWCLWGIVRLCIFVHPLLIGVAKKIDPVDFAKYPDPIPDGIVVWLVFLTGLALIIGILAAIHHFTRHLFKENESE